MTLLLATAAITSTVSAIAVADVDVCDQPDGDWCLGEQCRNQSARQHQREHKANY